jgi:hypothetical protein
MAKTKTPEQLARQAEKFREQLARQEERTRQITERRTRSALAMAQGPDVYARRIIASCLQIPFIHFWYSLFYIIFDYIFGGHIIVKTWQKALIKAGYISEGALGVAGLWALANHALHNFLVMNPLTNSIIDPMNAFTMGSFTLIPDLILASAIIVTINRYRAMVKKEGSDAWLWAVAYTIPTIIFACLTAYTLSTVNSLAGGGDMSKVIYATGTELQIRVLSAYFYGLIEILYAFTHKGEGHGLTGLAPVTPQINVQALIDQALAAQAAQHEQHLRTLATQQDQRLQLVDQEQQRLLATVQRIEDSILTLPTIDIQELITAAINDQEQRMRISIQEISEQAAPLQIAAPAVDSEALRQQVEAQVNHQTSILEQKLEALLQRASGIDGEALLQRASGSESEALLQRFDTLLNQKTASLKQAIEAELSGVKQQVQQVKAGVLHKVSDEVNRLKKNVEKTLADAAPKPAEKNEQPEKKAASPAGKAAESVPSNVLDFTQNLSRDAVMQLIDEDNKLLQLSDRALARKVGTTASTAYRAKTDYGKKHPEVLQGINKESGEAVERGEVEAAR